MTHDNAVRFGVSGGMPKGVFVRKTKTDILDQRFGRLLVLTPNGVNQRHDHLYLCRCDCGVEKSFSRTNLVRGLTTSCGCKHGASGPLNTRWGGVGKISGSTWALIKKGARDRDIPLIASLQEVWQQHERQGGKCALTGDILVFPKNCRDYTGNASLDRIDSLKPYEVGNIQWVTKDANLMKRNFTTDRFLATCLKVADYHRLNIRSQ